MLLAKQMTQCKTWNNVEVTRLKLYLVLFVCDKSFPFVDIVYSEIWTDHIGIVPFAVQLNMVDV